MSISSSLTIGEAPGIMASAAGAFSSPVAVAAAGASARDVGLSAPRRGGCCCATPDFGDFGNDELLWGGEQAGAFTDVHLTDDAVGDDGDAVDNVLHEGGPLDGIVGGVVEQQVGFEADEIDLAGFDVVLKVGGRVLTGEAVGVVAIGQEEDFDVQSFCKQHVDATQAGMDAGGVAIVEHGDIVGEAVDQAYLPLREGGAAGGDNVSMPLWCMAMTSI